MKKYAKFISLLLAVMMFAGVFAGCGGGSNTTSTEPSAPASTEPETTSTEPVSADFTTITEGVLTMSTNAEFPPYEMTDDNGDYIGIDVEVAKAIADKLGLTLQINDMGFDAAITACQNGASDIVMAGLTVSPDREAIINFSNTYAKGVQVVIVTEDSDIASIDDLEGKKIGTQMGTTGYIYCSDTPENGGYGEENVTGYDSGITAVQALINGQVDAVVIDNEPAKVFVQENPGLKILDTEFANEDYAIGVTKSNTALLDAINTALTELMNDGTFQSIVDKYITAE